MGIKLKEIDKIENIYLYSDGYSLEFSYDNKYLHFYNILYDLKTKEKFKIDDECCYNFTFKRNNKEAFFLLADESKKEYKVNLSLFSLNLDTKEKKLLIENAKKSSSYVNNFIYLGSLNQFWFLDEVGVITIYDEFSLKEIKKVFTIRDVMADKSKKVIEKSETPYETPSIWHVSSLTLSPNEKYIALNIANGICIYDIEEDKVINYVSRIDELEYTYKGETSFCRYEMKGELIYSSDSSKIFALDYFKYGIVYDAKTLEILQPLGNTSYFNLGGSVYIRDAKYTSDGKYLILSCGLEFRNANTGELVEDYLGQFTERFTLSKDDKYLALVQDEDTIIIYEMNY